MKKIIAIFILVLLMALSFPCFGGDKSVDISDYVFKMENGTLYYCHKENIKFWINSEPSYTEWSDAIPGEIMRELIGRKGDPNNIYTREFAHSKGPSGFSNWMEPFSRVDMFGKPTVFSDKFMEK